MIRRAGILALALGCIASGAWAELRHLSDDRLSFLNFGIFCVGPTVDQDQAPDTISGVVDTVESSQLVIATSVVPASLGVTFGVEFQGQPGVVGTLRLRTVHPPMGAEGATIQTWFSSVVDTDTTSIFYTFDEPFEQVPGEWRFEAEFNGELVYVVVFRVVPDGMAPKGDCKTAPLLS